MVTAQTAARASVAPEQRRYFAIVIVPGKNVARQPPRRDSYYCGARALRCHRLFHLGNELLERERLGQKIELAVGGKMLLKSIFGIAGHEDDLEARIARTQFTQKCRAVHLRHHDVRDDEIDLGIGFFQDVNRFDAVTGLQHRIAARSQTARIERTQTLLVLHQEDGAFARQIGDWPQLGGCNRSGGDLLCRRHMARQENAECGALAFDSVEIHESACLLDNAIDRRKAKSRAFAHFFGGKKRHEHLVADRLRYARPVIDKFDKHVVGGRHSLGVVAGALCGGDVGAAQLQMAAIGHGVARIDREVHDDLLELQLIDLDRPQVAAVHNLETNLLTDQPAQHDGKVAQHFAKIENLRAQRLLARKRHKMPHQAGRAIGALPDLHDVLERWIGRLVRVEQKIGREQDQIEHVVEIVRHAAGELADRVHFLLLDQPALELALLGRLQRIDDGRLLIAFLLADGGDVKARGSLALAGQCGVDRSDVPPTLSRLDDRSLERRPVALSDDGTDRSAAGVAADHALEQPGKQRIGPYDAAVAVDCGDRHRRVMEKSHEADFGGSLQFAAVITGTIEHHGARGTWQTVRTKRQSVKEANRQRPAGAGFQIKVNDLGLHLAGRSAQRCQQRSAIARDEVSKLEAARADLSEILIKPVRERGVEINDVAADVGGEEAGWGMIEVIDGALQLLKNVFLPLAVARDVVKRPDREIAGVGRAPQRANAHPQPARRPTMGRGDADFFLQPTALASRLEQPIDRLRGVRIANEDSLHRAGVASVGSPDQVEIRGITINHAPIAVGDDDAVKRAVEHGLDEWIAGL